MNWASVKDIVGKAAPLAGTLIGGPAGATVGALIANVLGVDPTPAAINSALNNAENRTELAKWEMEHKEKLQGLALGTLEAELNDKQNARDNHFDSKMPAVIVLALTVIVAILAYTMFNEKLPEENQEMAYMLVGQISALWGASITYWVGTTRSSSQKNLWISKK